MILNKIKILGIPYEIKLCEDAFRADGTHLGEIDYVKSEIRINPDMSDAQMEQTLIHEFVHGALISLGYYDENNNENLVQGLAIAINQTFKLKEEDDG